MPAVMWCAARGGLWLLKRYRRLQDNDFEFSKERKHINENIIITMLSLYIIYETIIY